MRILYIVSQSGALDFKKYIVIPCRRTSLGHIATPIVSIGNDTGHGVFPCVILNMASFSS